MLRPRNNLLATCVLALGCVLPSLTRSVRSFGMEGNAGTLRSGNPARSAASSGVLGQTVYDRACAACHGSDGRGAPSDRVGFDVPLPDLTDCNFTREPDLDWFAVTHDGGPARAFDPMMPAFGDALTEQEIDASIEHVRSFCDEEGWPRGELNFPRALVTEKAFPEDEALLIMSVTLEGPPTIEGKLIYEQRFGRRSQFEVIVPFGMRERTASADDKESGWAEGIGDIAFGAKHVVLASREAEAILSIAGEVFVPSGDEADGYGKGYFVGEPFLAYGQGFGDIGFVQLQVGAEVPFDADRPEEGFGRLALGSSFSEGRFGRTWTPMLEFAAARELTEGASVSWDYVPQIQITLNRRQHLMLNLGARIPMTELDRRPVEAMGYFLWDWFDGGLTDGW